MPVRQPMRYLLILAILLAGCSPEKRLSRLLANNPELRDTLEVEAMVEYIKGDTVFMDPLPNETLTYVNDRLTVKYVNVPGPTSYIYGECQGDTVRVNVPVIQPTKTVKVTVEPLWMKILIVALAGLAVLALVKR